MLSYLTGNWLLFTVLFALLLLLSFIMMKQSRFFYTKEIVVRRFSIMELELPGKPHFLTNLIRGIYKLLPENRDKSLQALRGSLWVDFLFMPAVYGCIFLLCMRIANKLQHPFGKYPFYTLAFLQVVPWICDIIENIYLLQKIRPDPQPSSNVWHRNYLLMEGLKWGIALTGFVCGFSVMCYYWLTGNYSRQSLYYLLCCIFLLLVFFLCAFLLSKEKKADIA